MDEIKEIQSTDELATWGTISSLMSRAADLASDIGRDDIVNMLSQSLTLMEKETSATRRFFDAFQFAFRIYFRLKNLDKSMPLDRVTKEPRIGKGMKPEDVYWVSNYSYHMFVWARMHGYVDEIDNLRIGIPVDKLSEAERMRMEKKLQS